MYFSEDELKNIGFKKLGKNVKISTKASIYNPEMMEIGNNSRIDDFCILSGKVTIGRNVHIAPFCLVAGAQEGVVLEDFSGLAYGVIVFTRSDDYSGETLSGPTVPLKYRYLTVKKNIIIKKYSIVGTKSVIFPGVILEEGTTIGAMSLVIKSTEPWSTYVGIPVRKIKDKKRNLLNQVKEYLDEEKNNEL